MKMRILVDGDGCPVVGIVENIAEEYGIELDIFTDLNHHLTVDYGKIFVVDQKYQSADMEIFNFCRENDIVVTGDYGLAAVVLGKGAQVISFSGKIFSDNNIDYLLMQRHQNFKWRRKTGRHNSHKKRSEADDLRFAEKLKFLIEKNNLSNNDENI
ncbi:hypothetical protein DFR78_10832 [Halanaerobium sp. MA284_MarDTE_T2]|nr:hypothetical protein DFR78_10832 [Halanaerobium sp. MA284_MarDTE_T2]RCW86607.1 hypothetical protein DER71_10870 [Halanaerobium sp. DL-01]